MVPIMGNSWEETGFYRRVLTERMVRTSRAPAVRSDLLIQSLTRRADQLLG
jgi:hypothetical protein